ncbi:hypothetical protein AVEN_255902-1 [Araneus ventricosus]|uniref:Transposable element P transposase n=1 Tax=Araneus ventricosus TaxID=182803 RepID=A0A4Y1ZNE8_ARAVE|nr:hypothetical protein AVEN_255902-1 [Araneus ventricosus]
MLEILRSLARGYGYDLTNQKIIIDKLKNCIGNLIICKTFKKTKKDTVVKRKEKSYFPFQKGFLMTIASLYGLYEDLKPLNVKFILTSKLNQDCLENFFSQIRGIAHFYDHPLPSEVKHRIRLILLGKNVDDIPFSSSANTSPCEDKSLLTNELLVHMSPDFSEPGKQSEIQEIIANEFSSDELTAIVDSSECSNDFSPDCSTEGLKYLAGYCGIIAAPGNILNCNYMQIGSALFVMSPIEQ